ncbi:Ca2+-dependent phosphoinositide-specific phospholipase C [Nannocystis sp. SCPEA4]|uniref:Ca2+-dependent phosphoinositide-specific phospholipase C n=1 Tax=Nannocystis sp. SCPEA4 TaxID=2996787 RepID=UPI002270C6D4|nr:Ca2+-dependent phosphoinositide-specific phospholipase C [Nannocystis sp. SCPEA4]MCY1056685.1 Ca2+-dependent phosphoinositide-specific phospholipase C [Nannocystis sp. SCPEA4]
MLRRALSLATILFACGGAPASTESGSSSGSGTGESSTTTADNPTSGGISGTETGTNSTSTATSTTSETTTSAPTTSGSTSTTTGETSTGDTTTGVESSGPRYHEVRQKSSHNSFQRHESLIDQLVYHRIRSLELDVHVGKSFESSIAGDWFVYHTDIIDADSQCLTLSQCLGLVAAFSRVVPEHEVVTLWIDLKDGFNNYVAHQPEDLDALLTAVFGEALVRPAELLAACPGATTLQEAVTGECTWPRLEAWRGRVIVMLTGGDLGDPSGALASYVGGDAGARAAFVAPGLSDAAALADHPEAIVHNLEIGDVTVAQAVRAAGLVSRVWVADDEDAWTEAEQAQVHHIATNQINRGEDPWANTAGPQGWPFTCFADDCGAPTSEGAAIVTMTVDSEDLWDSSDEGLFAGVEIGDEAFTWTAAVAVPSSHVEPWAKACVGARAGLAADAAYLAVCRAADDHPLRVQLRATTGASTEATELTGVAGLAEEAVVFVRLEGMAGAACVRGMGSSDGVAWTPIVEHCFAEPLTHVGLLAGSHGAGPLPLLFVAPTATPGGPVTAAELALTPLGAGVGAVEDGW